MKLFIMTVKSLSEVQNTNNSWPSRAWKKNSVGIFEYILASMLKVYLDVF